MKKKIRSGRILLVMIISQFMLAAFIIYWLRSQYAEERSRLVEKLTSIYTDTRDEVLDTLVFKSYVKPAITSTEIAVPKGVVIGDTIIARNNTGLFRVTGQRDSDRNDRKKSIRLIIHSGSDSSKIRHDTLGKSINRDELLIRSVRMIVANIDDSASLSKHKNGIIIPDTFFTDFKKHITHRMGKEGMNLSIIVDYNKDSAKSSGTKRIISINPSETNGMPEVKVKTYTWYLIWKIFPQIAFGFFLFLITALAFYLSHRNINEQILLNEARNDFISNITHELKTPVATISASIEALGRFKMRNEPGKMEDYLDLASNETKKLEELINRVLDHSLLENESQIMNVTDLDLVSLIRDIASQTQLRIERKGSIETFIECETLKIKGDPILLKGAIINLADNSIKYCDKEVLIRFCLREEKGNAIIEVIDNGPGIPEEYLTRIFDKFFRVPSGNIHNIKGYGLGLSFVQLVTRLHNGNIEVCNLNPGCRFTMKIPV